MLRKANLCHLLALKAAYVLTYHCLVVKEGASINREAHKMNLRPFNRHHIVVIYKLRKFSMTRTITTKAQVIKELPLLSETPMLKREVPIE